LVIGTCFSGARSDRAFAWPDDPPSGFQGARLTSFGLGWSIWQTGGGRHGQLWMPGTAAGRASAPVFRGRCSECQHPRSPAIDCRMIHGSSPDRSWAGSTMSMALRGWRHDRANIFTDDRGRTRFLRRTGAFRLAAPDPRRQQQAVPVQRPRAAPALLDRVSDGPLHPVPSRRRGASGSSSPRPRRASSSSPPRPQATRRSPARWGTRGWARSARPRRMEGADLLGGNQRGRRAGGECVLADSEPGRGSPGSERNGAPDEKMARIATEEDLTASQAFRWQPSSRCDSAKAASRSPRSRTRVPTRRGDVHVTSFAEKAGS
jgi:hypothetical protein